MDVEQEIRAKALELKLNYVAVLMAAAMQSGRAFNGKDCFVDGDLEGIIEYIKTGKKPVS
jgi:hypothetical protein